MPADSSASNAIFTRGDAFQPSPTGEGEKNKAYRLVGTGKGV